MYDVLRCAKAVHLLQFAVCRAGMNRLLLLHTYHPNELVANSQKALQSPVVCRGTGDTPECIDWVLSLTHFAEYFIYADVNSKYCGKISTNAVAGIRANNLKLYSYVINVSGSSSSQMVILMKTHFVELPIANTKCIISICSILEDSLIRPLGTVCHPQKKATPVNLSCLISPLHPFPHKSI